MNPTQYILWLLFGDPLAALVSLLVVWWIVDQLTWRLLPSPLDHWRSLARISALRRHLAAAPLARTRLALAEALEDIGQPEQALQLLEPHVDDGDADAETAFLIGRAAFGAGQRDRAETAMERARTLGLRRPPGAIDLELGRGRLACQDAAAACRALEASLVAQPSSIEAKVLLADALDAHGDTRAAAEMRAAAWRDYRRIPATRRREARPWAFHANPRALASYVAVSLAVIFALTWRLPQALEASTAAMAAASGDLTGPPPPPSRFERVLERSILERIIQDSRSEPGIPSLTVPPAEDEVYFAVRWDLDDDYEVDDPAKLDPVDFACRLAALYGPPDRRSGDLFIFRDRKSGGTIHASLGESGPEYYAYGAPRVGLREAIFALERLVASTPPIDCSFVHANGQGLQGLLRSGLTDGQSWTEPYDPAQEDPREPGFPSLMEIFDLPGER